MRDKVKPNFFIAGMPRSGTTSLYTYLKQHPDIYLSIYKEPNYFCRDLTQSDYNIQDDEIYFSLFADAHSQSCIGEGSVWYLTSKIAASAIKNFNPSAKIIVMLRQPIDMIYSLHALYVRTGNEDIVDFEEALEMEKSRRGGFNIPPGCYFPEGLLYQEVAKFYHKLKRFFDVFDHDQIHVIIFDEFAEDTAQCYRDTLRFLGVNYRFEAEFNLKKADARIRPLAMEQIRRAHPEVKRKLSNKTGLRAHKGPKRPPLTAELGSRLKSLFKEDIERTGELIGRNLANWIS